MLPDENSLNSILSMGKGTKWCLQHRIDLNSNILLRIYGRFDTKSFRYKSSRYESIQFRFTWLKERRIFTQNVFKWSPANYILEDFGIFLQYHCLSSYRSDLYGNDFVSKRPKSPLYIAPLTSSFFSFLSLSYQNSASPFPWLFSVFCLYALA